MASAFFGGRVEEKGFLLIVNVGYVVSIALFKKICPLQAIFRGLRRKLWLALLRRYAKAPLLFHFVVILARIGHWGEVNGETAVVVKVNFCRGRRVGVSNLQAHVRVSTKIEVPWLLRLAMPHIFDRGRYAVRVLTLIAVNELGYQKSHTILGKIYEGQEDGCLASSRLIRVMPVSRRAILGRLDCVAFSRVVSMFLWSNCAFVRGLYVSAPSARRSRRLRGTLFQNKAVDRYVFPSFGYGFEGCVAFSYVKLTYHI